MIDVALADFRSHRALLGWTGLCAALLPAYALVFWLDFAQRLPDRVLDATISVSSLWLLGLAAFSPLRKALSVSRKRLPSIALLGAGMIVFAFAWYILVASTYGWVNAGFQGGGAIPSFGGPAFRWQIFQGLLAVAALIAMIDAELAREGERAAKQEAAAVRPTPPVPLLIRDGDEMIRIDPAEIVSIVAENEESVINTGMRRFAVRRTLKEFEADLSDDFVRIHRSTLVNFAKIVRIEPAGAGRLTVHLGDGSSPVASKAGSKLLRQRAV